jgi:hypothetical protein
VTWGSKANVLIFRQTNNKIPVPTGLKIQGGHFSEVPAEILGISERESRH